MTTGSTNHATHEASGFDGQPYPGAGVQPGPSEPVEVVAPEQTSGTDTDSWRVEVAAKLERYRNRRKPRTPRYPSLLLPFDAPESWSRSNPPGGSAAVEAALKANLDLERPSADPVAGVDEEREISDRPANRYSPSSTEQYLEQSAKVIEFPRSAAIPVFHPSDLADPVFDHDRPRIVEAPEILPPPPALGGMLLEPSKPEPVDRRAADSPSLEASASIMRRAAAVFVDGLIQAVGLGAFAAMFVRLNPSLDPGLNFRFNLFRFDLFRFNRLNPGRDTLLLAAVLVSAALFLWMAYEFLFVVYTGSTPGLRTAKLRLARFDGSPPNRRQRRWRVLASFLAAFSAGLGYLWCFVDQDGLCWHDRITRTYARRADEAAGAAQQP
ncbi:MAG TPA: RDD family protein [Terriglobales bacterium]|nr:RDD family protein [Terriglobales bacterium]